MMTGRKPLGSDLVWNLEGPQETLAKLKVLLDSMYGLPLQDACGELGVGKAMLNRDRIRALRGARDALLPRRRGRPPAVQQDHAALLDLIAELEAENVELRAQVKIANLKHEIETILPLETRAEEDEALKKTKRQRRRKRKRLPR